MKLELMPQTTIRCSHCPREALEDESNAHLCPTCLELAGRKKCTSCGGTFVPEFVCSHSDIVDSYPLCEDCTIVCPACDTRTENDLVEVLDWNPRTWNYDEVEVCGSCRNTYYARCGDCSKYVTYASTTNINGSDICKKCLDSYLCCDVCSDWVTENNTRVTDEGTYCADCFRQMCSAKVHEYGYSPRIRFFDADGQEDSYPSGLYHGIELECGYVRGDQDDYAEQVVNALGSICYLKEDGSIVSGTGLNGGFEIVTHPCDLEWYRKNLSSICNGAIPGLLSHNTQNAGCGLHISVNKNGLTNHATARICAFIGADRNENWIVKLARRKADRWAEIVKKNSVEDTLYEDGSLRTNSKRYEAVNLQNFSHVEFRLFRGTLKYSSAMLCLEFVNALCLWSLEPCEVSQYQSAEKLLEFAKTRPDTYPHLIKFLCANI